MTFTTLEVACDEAFGSVTNDKEFHAALNIVIIQKNKEYNFNILKIWLLNTVKNT
ncbi:hypothetical protein GCM10011352_23110 [Marinobacterium zhoushanense]|uniref:Uncharacterized protein n=1 Tax=Marinobacterium zhoushanense TaxID=1679163 RepID=A0ABQ1KGL7_9GAMM|nr:hypothetical protein GCM10011352_23110 [Marinobacterium zhoushanense]